LSNRLLLACGLAWGAAAIHLQAAVEHVDEYVPYAVCFLLLALAQLLWGFAIGRAPTRRLLAAGALGSLMVVALWVVSRTSGLPVGPETWEPERVGALDSLASADEVLLALIVAFELGRGRAGMLLRACTQLATGAGVCLVLLSSLSLAYAGHAH
jgi:hypothetical protein